MKVGGVMDVTGGFGFKVRQVSAGFGCGEGYYGRNSLLSFIKTPLQMLSKAWPSAEHDIVVQSLQLAVFIADDYHKYRVL